MGRIREGASGADEAKRSGGCAQARRTGVFGCPTARRGAGSGGVGHEVEDDVQLAHDLASVAADVALGFVGGRFHYELKADGTPVTEADLAVEATLVDLIRARRPDDAILSEEAGTLGTQSRRRWVLDPIDGTAHFVNRTDGWGTHIALEVDGELVLGMITRPLAGSRWWAVRGCGAYRANENAPGEAPVRLTVSDGHMIDASTIGVYAQPGSQLPERLTAAGADVRRIGSHVPDLADGRIDAVVADHECGFWWDHAPALIITQEAGGVFTDAVGARPGRHGGIYAHPALLEQITVALGWR